MQMKSFFNISSINILLVFASFGNVHGFAPVCRPPMRTMMHMIDPISIFLVDSMEIIAGVGIAAVSAAAGAASQIPRIQELENELAVAWAEVNATRMEMVDKINLLEEKLFIMDQEFEGQTARFKRQYDARMKEDLARITDKLKTDFQYQYEIKLEQQKSQMLGDKLSVVNGLTERQGALSVLQLQNERMQEANRLLEQALKDSETELLRMREEASKKRFPLWF